MKVTWEQIELDKFIAKVRAGEREACCRDVCPHCANRIPIQDNHPWWHIDPTKDRWLEPCAAAAIRARSCSLENENEQPTD